MVEVGVVEQVVMVVVVMARESKKYRIRAKKFDAKDIRKKRWNE